MFHVVYLMILVCKINSEYVAIIIAKQFASYQMIDWW